MATGYHLEVGYNSGCSGFFGTHEDAANILLAVVRQVAESPLEILMEAGRERGLSSLSFYDDILDYAKRFQYSLEHPDEDGTVTITPPRGNESWRVMLLATGGPGIEEDGAWGARSLKELVRRAFCRLVILEMHRRGIEVSLVVA